MTSLRVLIADDHPVFRDGIRALLEATPASRSSAKATTGREAVDLAEQHQPDLVLMDVAGMPGTSAASRPRSRIVTGHPEIRVLVVTMFEDDAQSSPRCGLGRAATC